MNNKQQRSEYSLYSDRSFEDLSQVIQEETLPQMNQTANDLPSLKVAKRYEGPGSPVQFENASVREGQPKENSDIISPQVVELQRQDYMSFAQDTIQTEDEPIIQKNPIQSNNHSEKSESYVNKDIGDEVQKDGEIIFDSLKIKRQASSLEDIKKSICNKQQGAQRRLTADQNKKIFLENFGIKVQLPTQYIIDSKVYILDTNFSYQLSKFCLPEQDNFKICSHYLDNNSRVSTYKEIFQRYSEGLVLRLLQTFDGGQIKKVSEMVITDLTPDRVLMEFSHDGTLFCLFCPDLKYIKVFKFDPEQNAINQFKLIKNDHTYCKYQFENQDLKSIKQIKYDENQRYVIGFGATSIFVLNIEAETCSFSKINHFAFEQIFDVFFVSNDGKGDYKCFMALKKKNQNQIQVLEFLDFNNDGSKLIGNQTNKIMSLNFSYTLSETVKVKLSCDCKSLVFIDQKEQFIMEQNEHGDYCQRNIKNVRDKMVHYIQEDHSGGFYLITSKEYDTKIKLEHTSSKQYCAIQRNVEPGIIKVFDFFVSAVKTSQDQIDSMMEQTQTKTFQLINMKDEQFYVNKVSYLEGDNSQFNHEEFAYSSINAFSIKWPYVAFSGIQNFIMIYNAFDSNLIHRIEIAGQKEFVLIQQTFITDTNDLFILIKRNTCYQLYMFDLDASNVREQIGINQNYQYKLKEPILEYQESQVDYKPITTMIVRGSSRKEKIDTNQLLVVFLKHGDQIFSWTQIQQNACDHQGKLQFVDKIASQMFYRLNDCKFYYLRNQYDENNRLVDQDIKCIEVEFNDFEMTSIHFCSQNQSLETIKSINLDQEENKLILLFKQKMPNKKVYKFKIFDLNINDMIYEAKIEYEPLIGRLQTGTFTFIKGHIYYKNNVIKIRYDLINSANNQQYKMNEIFDYYYGIFRLDDSKRVRADTPLDSQKSHRFGYLISDLNFQEPLELFIIPYLHDRRIYLNRIKLNTEYFYTQIETTEEDERDYHNKIESKLKENFQISKVKQKILDGKSKKFEKFKSMICCNLTEHKYYVYSMIGILINRIDFSEEVKKYGEPIATSGNGQNFIFRKDINEPEMGSIDKIMTISIVNMTIFGLSHIKDINVYESIKTSIKNKQTSLDAQNLRTTLKIELPNPINQQQDPQNDELWLFEKSLDQIKNEVEMTFEINDKFDICVKLRSKELLDYEKTVIFYFENGMKNISHSIINEELYTKSFWKNITARLARKGQRMQSYVHMCDPSKKTNFCMNDDCIYFWDDYSIEYCNLHSEFTESQNFDFKIAKQAVTQFQPKIQSVMVGSHVDQVVIVVNQSPDIDCVLIWDQVNNCQIEAYELSEDYEITWDSNGNPYILINGKVFFSNEKCSIKAFDYQDIQEFKQIGSKFPKGHRLDGDNHNWLILQEYFALPFSYMTFVIKDKIEIEDQLQNGNVFDLEPYNYLFNKSTSFIDGDFVYMDHRLLQNVLQNLQSIDPDLLEILHYCKTQFNRAKSSNEQISALHIAVNQGNNRSVDIILNFMSQINFNASKNFRDIFVKLIEFPGFASYFDKLPEQNHLMERKQVLRVEDAHDDLIIAMTSWPTIYMDESFFHKEMKEQRELQRNCSSHPVKVQALKASWIIQLDEGKQFLNAILNTDSIEFYNVRTVQMIVEFLYSKQKKILFFVLLPIFILQIIFYEMIVYFSDRYLDSILRGSECYNLSKSQADSSEKYIQHEIQENQILMKFELKLSFILFAVMFAINFVYSVFSFTRQKLDFFKHFQNWIDMVYTVGCAFMFYSLVMVLNFEHQPENVDIICMIEQEVKMLRISQAFLMMLIYFRSFYFLALVDKISPIMDIFFRICWDIRYFCLVLGLFMYMYSCCFSILSKNQIQFDGLSEKELSFVSYNGRSNAFWYLYDMMLGNTTTSPFNYGQHSQRPFLYAVFFVASFTLLIHLLNMLIAIMGNTFDERKELQVQTKIKDHLKFVMDNWHLINYAFEDKNRVRYIITAFSADEQHDDEDAFHNMQQKIEQMESSFSQSINNIMIKVNDIQTTVNIINQKQDHK